MLKLLCKDETLLTIKVPGRKSFGRSQNTRHYPLAAGTCVTFELACCALNFNNDGNYCGIKNECVLSCFIEFHIFCTVWKQGTQLS